MTESPFREIIEQPSDRVIVALDDMDWYRAEDIMQELQGTVGMGKANSIAQREGWSHAISTLARLGHLTMADAKFHDIPKTVELSVQEVASSGPAFITVHASGGIDMLRGALSGADNGVDQFSDWGDGLLPDDDPRNVDVIAGILGITVLTSLDGETCESIFGTQPEEKVLQFAYMAVEAGIEGIVCSGKELKAIRAHDDLNKLIAVVPGITPAWTQKAGDQKRIVTPTEALQEGADYIVVGRAITQPPEGMSAREAAERIADELGEAA